MNELTITLPAGMRPFIETEMRTGGYVTPSDYVHALVRTEQQRKARAELESLLLQGLESGPLEAWNTEDLEAIRREVHERRRKAPNP